MFIVFCLKTNRTLQRRARAPPVAPCAARAAGDPPDLILTMWHLRCAWRHHVDGPLFSLKESNRFWWSHRDAWSCISLVTGEYEALTPVFDIFFIYFYYYFCHFWGFIFANGADSCCLIRISKKTCGFNKTRSLDLNWNSCVEPGPVRLEGCCDVTHQWNNATFYGWVTVRLHFV